MDQRFDLYELPEGHLERFEAKLKAQQSRQRMRILRWTTAAAAALALLLTIGVLSSSPLKRAHSPEAVYAAYLQQVDGLYAMLAGHSSNGDNDWEGILNELTRENIPLYDQLPEELSRREKTALLKQHYGTILQEARQLKSMKQ